MEFLSDPIRLSNTPRDRTRIEDHLLRLSVTDRYLRFCSALSDQAILGYIDQLDMSPGGKDVVYGVVNAGGSLAGMLHVAPTDRGDSAEFALSVDENQRKRGIGDKLFGRGLLHCEAVGIKQIYMNCLSTNEAIKKMARRRNMTITSDYGETIATLDLKNHNQLASWLQEVQTDAIALYDLRCLPMRQSWENYITEIRKIVGDKT